jgi:hypothetical protein
MITDRIARRIAASWHGGQGSALYALCSTGAINTGRSDHNCEAEIADCFWSGTTTERDNTDLLDLDEYVKAHHPRGPVASWSRIPW